TGNLEPSCCDRQALRQTGRFDDPPWHDAAVEFNEAEPAREELMAAHTDQVLESFDSIADIFDEEFENDVTRRLRTQIYETVGGLVPAGSSVLDINCGTGIDAIALAGRGYKVSGIDLSPKMIERARRKADRHCVPASFQVSSFENLESIAESAFDLMLS